MVCYYGESLVDNSTMRMWLSTNNYHCY